MSDRTPTEVLKAARERITPEDAWTTKTAARDASGMPDWPCSPSAVAWCALGAIECETGRRIDPYVEPVRLLRRYLYRSRGGRLISMVNDLDGHAATLKMFDEAIALAEAE